MEQIRRKNKELDGTISGSRASQAAATQKLQSLRSKISSTRSRQEQLANEANKYRASIVSAQNKVAETNAATNALHAERGALRNAAELASLDAEASELESKVASAVTGQQIRLSRISDLEAELEQIRAENSRLEAEHVAMVAAMRSYLDAAGS